MPFATPLSLTDFDYGNIDTLYIFCEEDRALKFSDQQWMAARMQGKKTSLPADHSPFISMPEALAELLA